LIKTVALPVGANPVDLVASPDGSHFYVANKGTQNVSVFTTLNNTLVTNIDITTNSNTANYMTVQTSNAVYPVSLTVSTDSSKLAVAVVDANYMPTAAIVPAVNGQPDGDAALTIDTGTNLVIATLGAPYTFAGCGSPFVMTDPTTHNQTVCTRMHPIIVLQ
jgi:hypothetical protein